MKYISIFFVVLVVLFPSSIRGRHLYRDFLTGFAGISNYTNPANGFIEIDNRNSDTTFVETTEFQTKNQYFHYTIRLNDGNGVSARQKFLNKPASDIAFGLVWNFIDNNNFQSATLCRISRNPYDEISRQQYFLLKIEKVKSGKRESFVEKEISPDLLDPDSNEFNSLKITYSEEGFSIYAGHAVLKQVYANTEFDVSENCRIGYFIEPGGVLSIKRISYEDYPIKERLFLTDYTQDALNGVLEGSTDPLEGYWQYLDRNTDDRFFDLGGKYTVAIVKNTAGGYDVIYMSGARLYPQLWEHLMKKGVLECTPFSNHYNLTWHDARKKIFNDESYAMLSDGILSFYFPLQKSQVRFYKLEGTPIAP